MKIYYIKDDKCVNLTPRIPELDEKTTNNLIKLGITSIIIYETCIGNQIYAATNISKAVQPLVDILIDLAEPVSYAFMVKGFFSWMAGQEHEGKKTLKASIGGYLGIQFIPQIFKIIKEIKLG